MKVVLTFLNDWRDSILYSILAVLIVLSAAHRHLHGCIDCFEICGFREICRYVAWMRSEHRVKIAILPVVYSSMALGLTSPDVMSIFLDINSPSVVAFDLFLVCANLSLGLFISRDFIKYMGLKRTANLYARFFWKEIFDYPRKQKPPAHRWRESKKAVERLLAKVREAMSPSPLPVPASRSAA